MEEYLEKKSRSRWVNYLQISLICFGYNIGPYGTDGIFGDSTEAAVIQFQRDNNLTQDGKVGKGTWKAIKNKIIPIQEKLIEKNYGIGECKADGIYGNSTFNAVKQFHKDNNLKVDGIAGPETQRALFNKSNSGGNGTPSVSDIGKYIIQEYYINSKTNKGIRNIQNALYTLGYNIGSSGADGIFGQNTRNSIIKFQSDHGLEQNGLIDLLTIITIKREIQEI